MKIIVKVAIVIVVVVIFLGSVGAIVYLSTFAKPTFSTSPTPASAPTASSSSTSTPTALPTLTLSYVELDYQTVGWFYSNSGDSLTDTNYNYTYLVLNVTVINHGYSQINVIGEFGFSVLVNGNNYTPPIVTPTGLYNGSTSDFYGMKSVYSFNSALPDPATLLNTGSVIGIVIFQFGSPTLYPPQSQILNSPFTLQYSVTYGDSFGAITGLSGPYATIVINQK